MVNFHNTSLDLSNCEITQKNRLRHEDMGNTEGHHQQVQQQHQVQVHHHQGLPVRGDFIDDFSLNEGNGTPSGKFGPIGQQKKAAAAMVHRYTKDEILELKEVPGAKVKPKDFNETDLWWIGTKYRKSLK